MGNTLRKSVKRKLKVSIPKHIEAIQEILFNIHIQYKEGNDEAVQTSTMCLFILEATEELEQMVKQLNKTI